MLNRNKIFLSFIFFFLIDFVGKSQCDADALMSRYAPVLDDFVFIKSFNIDVKKDGEKSTYSYVFSRGNEYRIVLSEQSKTGKKMIINLLDRDKKLIASNFLKAGKKFYPTVNYICSATGVYYIEAYFDGDKQGCGINILGVKKK